MLTKEQELVLIKADKTGGFPVLSALKLVRGFHWCPEWDYLAICSDSPEYEYCTCKGKIKMTKRYIEIFNYNTITDLTEKVAKLSKIFEVDISDIELGCGNDGGLYATFQSLKIINRNVFNYQHKGEFKSYR